MVVHRKLVKKQEKLCKNILYQWQYTGKTMKKISKKSPTVPLHY